MFKPYYAFHQGLKAVFFVVSPDLAISVRHNGQNKNFYEAAMFAGANNCYLPSEEQWLLGLKHPEVNNSGLYEWTTSEEGDSRVLRGGWGDYNLNFARAVSRYYAHPSTRYYDLGFRVCASPENLIRLEGED